MGRFQGGKHLAMLTAERQGQTGARQSSDGVNVGECVSPTVNRTIALSLKGQQVMRTFAYPGTYLAHHY